MPAGPVPLLASSPWVRMAKVSEASGFSGEWVDFDHVYTFVHRGQADFIFDGMRLRAGPGTALVMPPGVRHLVRSSRPGQTVVQQIVHFDLTYDAVRAQQQRIGSTALEHPAGYPRERSALAGRLPVAELPPPAADACRAHFAELRLAMAASGEAAMLRRQAAMLSLLALVLQHEGGRRQPPAQQPSRAWRALDRVIGHLHACHDDPGLDIAAIAKATGLSPAYLPELFRTQLGTSVRRYLLHIRVRRARELLGEGLSVGAVAERTGFSGIHAFSRAFRRVAGVPPSAIAAADPRQG